MTMNKKTVAVIFGGQSSEHEVSRVSAAMIISNLNPEKYFVIPVGITKKGKWLIYSGPVEHIKSGEWEKYGVPAILSPDATQKCLLKRVGGSIKEIPVDVVFPALHGLYGEDGTIQGLLELSQIPYVGCGVLASSITMDKVYTKMVAKSLGIPQAKHLWFRRDALKDMKKVLPKIEKKLGFPCFIKPSNAGSSVGISKARNAKELEDGLLLAAKYDRKIIIEEFVDGREIECSVLGNEEPIVSGVGEVFAGAEFYDYEAKYKSTASRTEIPASLPPETVEKIRKIASKIYRGVDGTGLARVDFFVDKKTGAVIFNELNAMPGFTPISMYPMLWEQEGMSNGDMVDKMIELALERSLPYALEE